MGLVLLAFAVAAQALVFPQLTGRVVDEAGIIDQATRIALEQKLAGFEAKTTGQFVVVILKSLQGTSIEDYGYQLGRHWGIGQKEKNSGVLLIIVPSERKVRFEVGYGLEGQLTDAVSKLIIENSIVPRFRAGDFVGGINRGVDDVIQVLTVDPEEWRQRAKQRPDNTPWILTAFLVMLLVIAVLLIARNLGQSSPAWRRRAAARARRGSSDWSWSSGSSDSSWSGSSGGFDSGGFSGGGGSFGGGGASGSW